MTAVELNTRVNSIKPLITPDALLTQLPLSNVFAKKIQTWRQTISNILQGNDNRLLVITGPCSIHDEAAALEYAQLLKRCSAEFANELFIVMRVYFEKPRTLVGWKGLISDPFLNGSYQINEGLQLARNILLQLLALDVPAATEFLDTIIPQYLADLVSWCAVGARTVESQIHRELASGLSMPVGFKNSTDGNIKVAIDAVSAATHSHHFLGISTAGIPSVISTMGNKDCHIILRGANSHTNYSSMAIQDAVETLLSADLTPRVMIDCSHGNSMKRYQRQTNVIESIREQLQGGSTHIFGVMLESNLIAGKQTLKSDQPLVYGQSITDACLSWDETYGLLKKLASTQQQLHAQININ